LIANNNTSHILIDACAFIAVTAMTEDSEDSNDVFFNSVVDYVDKIMFVFAQENQKMEVSHQCSNKID